LGHEFETIDDLIGALTAEGVREVTLAAKVATTTIPGGDQISFRGRIVVEATLPGGPRAEYVEQVMPYIATTRSPGIAATADQAANLRAAQRALARQLRSYRGEYQGVVAAARAHVTEKLRRADITVVEPDD